ncbi:MAG: hypothetical protein P1V18_02580 [Candidatus Gracilibacteria bacterium]|nr:hypothetical protein [Candidatus Gracilibacteria bacterium]
MKSFQYTAIDESGETISGTIEVDRVSDATKEIQGRGLELQTLEQINGHAGEIRPFIFDAMDKEGDTIQGTIQGVDRASVKKVLEGDFGYVVNNINVKDERQSEVFHEPKSQTSESSIIFSSEPTITHKKSDIPLEKVREAQQQLEELLTEKGAALSDKSKEIIDQLLEKLDLVSKSQNKKHWKRLKYQLRDHFKSFKREVEEYEQQKWDELEKKSPSESVESYTDFNEKPVKVSLFKRKVHEAKEKIQAFDSPNIRSEQEVLVKQQYESVWVELQRFMGALFFFYIACFFVAYYLKRSGFDENVLVRIFDTTVFKQLVITLFTFYGLLSLRHYFLSKRLASDIVLLGVFGAVLVIIYS